MGRSPGNRPNGIEDLNRVSTDYIRERWKKPNHRHREGRIVLPGLKRSRRPAKTASSHAGVGVVKDIKLDDITEGERAVGAYFFPMTQDASRLVTFAVKPQTRAAARPEAVAIGFATIPERDEGGLSIAALTRMIIGAVRGRQARR